MPALSAHRAQYPVRIDALRVSGQETLLTVLWFGEETSVSIVYEDGRRHPLQCGFSKRRQAG